MEKFKYMQLAQALREAVQAGVYPVGAPLPGERELARLHHCSRHTVRQAVRVLCEEKVLRQVHGSGNYVLRKARPAKSGLVAVVATHIALPNFATTLLSIEKSLIGGGYYPVVTTTGNRFDLERRALEDLLEKNVDGLVAEAALSTIPNPNIQLYREFAARGIPVVFINARHREVEQAVSVSMDNLQGGTLCGQYLAAQGHRNIAGIFKADDQESMERYSGLARYLSGQGRPLRDGNLLWYTSTNLQGPLEAFALSCLEGCTAVACFNDEVAYALCETLQRNGVRLPEGFEFVAFDRTEFALRIPHKTTALQYRQEAIGKLAAQKVINMIAGRHEASRRLRWQLFDAQGNRLAPHDIAKA